ncbi:PDC sensor domain-containing protein [Sporosalibacterium faouarense]|uniref:PDC sensor domain-containing protein n=1 Tax=Sporosalibacterium faouarense TaxID=516123 RepID=UPI00141C3BF7|nr:PDC sensor domain-containing protein [Sporosalibacterium faouarense]MTI47937.1 hypothetical protein [Bacillota bacterium]
MIKTKQKLTTGLILILIVLLLSACGASLKLTTNNNSINANSVKGKEEISSKLDLVKEKLNLFDKEMGYSTDQNEIQKYLDKFVQENNENILNAYMGFETGGIIISPQVELPENFNAVEGEWYKKAKGLDYFVSEPYMDFSTGKNIITVSKSIVIDNEIKGVIGIDYITDKSNEKTTKQTSNNTSKEKTPDLSEIDMDALVDDLSSLSQSMSKLDNSDDITQQLNDFRENSELKITNVYFALKTGEFIISPYVELPEDYDVAERAWYKNALDKEYYVSGIFKDISTDANVFSLSKAVYKDDEFIGVLGIDVVLP